MRVLKNEQLIYRNVGESEMVNPNPNTIKVGDEK